jgi:phosphoglycerate dehydrogenase-like enzyme
VLQSEDLDPAAAAWLRESCDLVECHFSCQPRFDELLADAQGLVVRTYTRVDERLLDRAPRLRVVGRAGVGLDHIDVGACRRRGVQVVHTPAANCDAVAEYVFAMLFGALRPRYRLRSAVDLAEWNRLRKGHEATSQLNELTLGVFGLGRVGSRVARIARGVGMRVLYSDLLDIPESSRHGATPVPPDTLLRDSDIVTIHVDGRSENQKWFSERFCSLLRPTAIIVNSSRGLVLDEHALACWLRAHPAGMAPHRCARSGALRPRLPAPGARKRGPVPAPRGRDRHGPRRHELGRQGRLEGLVWVAPSAPGSVKRPRSMREIVRWALSENLRVVA